jgi:dipeptidyl aminopeptidase/acylaminoacyl peptidase
MGSIPNISPAMVARGRPLNTPMLSPDGSLIAFTSADRLLTVPTTGGPERAIAVDPPPGPFVWLPDGTGLVYAAKDRILTVSVTGGPGRTLVQADEAVTAFAVSPAGRIAYTVDNHHVVLEGRRISDADFVFDPTWSPDGETLVWHEWDLPDMPWDASRIVDMTGRVRAGGPDHAVQQPRFSPDGRLAFLSDATGWLNVWIEGADRPVLDEPHEHGDPAWFPGQRSFCWAADGQAIALNRNEAGFGRLITVDVATGTATERRRGVHRSLSWHATSSHIAALRTGARTPTQITLDRTTLAYGPVAGFEPALVEPESVQWLADDHATIHGRLYRPTSGDSQSPPPLIVLIHGGPTGQDQVIFDAKTAFWVDRGWAVLVPDFRGSTGWGRAYQQALRTRWGELDVDDVASGMRAAVRNRWAHPRRMVPMGGSSGGMTVLLLLARHPELCAAGVANYPVADLLDLARHTHRFEAQYTYSMVAPLPKGRRLHRERSPMAHADRITRPLLVFHGLADDVVPPRQTRKLVARLRANDVDVEHVEYPGEGHGFRRPANVEDQLRRTEEFLARTVLGLPE